MSLFPETITENFGSQRFVEGLKLLDMEPKESLGFVYVSELRNSKRSITPTEWFALEKAERFGAKAIYFRRFADGRASIPQVYIFDFTANGISDNDLGQIQKEIWNSGEVRIAYIFKNTEVIFLNSSIPPRLDADNLKPEFIGRPIQLAAKAKEKLKEFSGKLYDDGSFWESNLAEKKLKFDKSAYKLLLQHLSLVKNEFIEKSKMPRTIAHDLIIQCMLVKYIEERVNQDIIKSKELKVFFKKYAGADNLEDILVNGKILNLFDGLNRRDKLNGDVFKWDANERKEVTVKRQKTLSTFLSAKYDFNGQGYLWQQYSFTYLPVELISRLYEEFLEEGQKGKVYTPAHLAKFLVDESMPLNVSQEKIELDYKILDPSCGSGVFLVSAFKRLVQWWRIKNNFKEITETDIDSIKYLLLNNIYGVDIDPQAAKLTTFSLSLALCDMLTPSQIWTGLKFEKLRDKNIIARDFFLWRKDNKDKKFDLVIGNPPFIRGGFSDTENEDAEENVEGGDENTQSYSLNQLALKFLGESIENVKDNGLQCLIIFSPSILYNTSSLKFRKQFFSGYNVKQIIDFTPLYRNKSLWDNKEPATVAVFTRKTKPDEKNILHLVIRRTKPTKERLFFEISEYDFHYVTKTEAVSHPAIWKINLLGGGRLATLYEKFRAYKSIQNYIEENDLLVGEGFIKGTNGTQPAKFLAGRLTLPTQKFTENGIIYSDLEEIKSTTKFVKLADERLFSPPNLLIKENIGAYKIPLAINKRNIVFKDKIISIVSKTKATSKLEELYASLKLNMPFYRCWIYITSGQVLVSKNTAILKEDIMKLPFIKGQYKPSAYEQNLIDDVLEYSQDFLRYGETSKVVNKIRQDSGNEKLVRSGILMDYADCLTEIINSIYKKNEKKFRLSSFIIGENYVEVKFAYTDKKEAVQGKTGEQYNHAIEELIYHQKHENLAIRRIIRIYGHDEITIIKPNQLRYWLKSIGYRDGDKIFSELVKQGF